MSSLLNKPSRSMNWFYTGFVLVVLLTACYIISSYEREEKIELYKNQISQTGSLLSEMIQTELMNNNYTAVINIIDKWFYQEPSVCEIIIQSDNGFILSDLKQCQQNDDTIDYTQNIQYGYNGNISINIKNSLEYLTRENDKNIYYLLLIAIILTFASGEFFWLIEQKQYNKALENLSYRDQLTEIFNRRYFDETLYQEWHRAMRTQQSLSLIMLDVDKFKPYNDTHGHQAGDACLAEIAGTLHKTLKRPGEFVARYGGEEFAVVLPNINHEHVIEIAEMLRHAIEGLAIPADRNNSNPSIVTISLGTATHDNDNNNSPEELISLADQALYKAKQKGRNCVQTS